jgi:hypothetical protein
MQPIREAAQVAGGIALGCQFLDGLLALTVTLFTKKPREYRGLRDYFPVLRRMRDEEVAIS